MRKDRYVTIAELAKIVGLSRSAVYKKVKKGQIQAVRIGRTLAIPQEYIDVVLGNTLREEDKEEIARAVKKAVEEYGEVLRLFGRE